MKKEVRHEKKNPVIAEKAGSSQVVVSFMESVCNAFEADTYQRLVPGASVFLYGEDGDVIFSDVISEEEGKEMIDSLFSDSFSAKRKKLY